MNEIVGNETEIALPLVEILDAEGNPTGQYTVATREGEDAQEVFTTVEDGDHAVTVH